jgi:hypothetical protein
MVKLLSNKIVMVLSTNLNREILVQSCTHPLRDGRSNEQVTQQAERSTPPTTVRMGWDLLYLPGLQKPYISGWSRSSATRSFGVGFVCSVPVVNSDYCREIGYR